MAAVSCFALLQVHGSVHRPSHSHHSLDQLKTSLSSNFKTFFEELKKLPMAVNVSQTIRNTTSRTLDALVDSLFRFVDQPLLPSQINFAPVEVNCIKGKIPTDFSQGVYVRNGPNPLFGGLKTCYSIFGRSDHNWAEGEGMLHALHFRKKSDGEWSIYFNNRYVESETFKLETQLNKPSFLPAIEGDSLAVLAAYVLNMWRFGKINKHLRNTSVFEHGGKVYAIAENYLPQEIDVSTLLSLEDWDVNGAWDRPFTSHPKKAPGTGELVVFGVNALEPYFVVGVISGLFRLFHGSKSLSSSLAWEIVGILRISVIDIATAGMVPILVASIIVGSACSRSHRTVSPSDSCSSSHVN